MLGALPSIEKMFGLTTGLTLSELGTRDIRCARCSSAPAPTTTRSR